MKKTGKKSVEKALFDAGVFPDQLTLSRGVYTFRLGFFYTHGGTSQKCADEISKALPGVQILDHGKVWRPFRGGASVRSQSHWYVKFQFPKE